MPFTITHIAAITPVAWASRNRLPFSALAIGSMICDVPVFFPWMLDYNVLHSFLGVVTHCTPIGVTAYFLFHALLKRPLSTLLPRSMAVRLAPWVDREVNFSLSNVALVVACVALGSCTHVIWDAFTHYYGWGVKMFPALQTEAIRWGDRTLDWYEVLQHGSSVVFLPPLVAGLAWWIYRQPVVEAAKQRRSLNDVLVLVVLCTLVFVTFAYALGVHHRFPDTSLVMVLRDSVRRVGIVTMITMAIYCAVSIFSELRRQTD